MREEQATYSTGDMLKLINTAATNLVLKKKKVSIEGHIRKLTEERDYTLELVTRARKKVEELDPELREAEARARESLKLFTLLKAECEARRKELERLLEIKRKAALLQQLTGEVTVLREDIASLQNSYSDLQPVCDERKARKKELEQERLGLMALKDELEDLRTAQKLLFAGLADICTLGNLDMLVRHLDMTAELLYSEILTGDIVLSVNLFPFLDYARQIYEIDKKIDAAIKGEHIGRGRTELFAIRDAGVISHIKGEIEVQAAKFRKLAELRIHKMEEQKGLLMGELEAARQRHEKLEKDKARLKEELSSEQKAGISLQALSKELEAERAAQAAELEQIKKKAETIDATIELNKLFAEALGPVKEYMENINRRLTESLEEYKRAFESVAWVVRENIK